MSSSISGGFPSGSVVKNLPANAGDVRDSGLTPGSGRSPGVGNDNHSSILAWKIPGEPGCRGVAKESDGMEHVINAFDF